MSQEKMTRKKFLEIVSYEIESGGLEGEIKINKEGCTLTFCSFLGQKRSLTKIVNSIEREKIGKLLWNLKKMLESE